MKSIFTLIYHLGLVVALTAASNVTAATDESTETARISQAIELYTRASAIEPNSTEQSKLLRQSESILLEVVEHNPAALDAHRKLMGVYLQLRDYRRAIQTLQNAISLSPEDPKLFIALAILYDHQGAYEYAIPILDEALALEPNQQLAREYKASIENKIATRNMAMKSNASSHHVE